MPLTISLDIIRDILQQERSPSFLGRISLKLINIWETQTIHTQVTFEVSNLAFNLPPVKRFCDVVMAINLLHLCSIV